MKYNNSVKITNEYFKEIQPSAQSRVIKEMSQNLADEVMKRADIKWQADIECVRYDMQLMAFSASSWNEFFLSVKSLVKNEDHKKLFDIFSMGDTESYLDDSPRMYDDLIAENKSLEDNLKKLNAAMERVLDSHRHVERLYIDESKKVSELEEKLSKAELKIGHYQTNENHYTAKIERLNNENDTLTHEVEHLRGEAIAAKVFGPKIHVHESPKNESPTLEDFKKLEVRVKNNESARLKNSDSISRLSHQLETTSKTTEEVLKAGRVFYNFLSKKFPWSFESFYRKSKWRL